MNVDFIPLLHKISERTDLRGKRVLVRAGLDVPLSAEGAVTHTFRIKKALPTLQLLRAAGAKVVIIAHSSRADGSSDDSLKGVCEVLNTYIPVAWVGTSVGPEVDAKIASLKEGELLLLENLRLHPGEKDNDPAFAQTLASYGDIYVNDAFSVAHREHASIVGIPKFLPSYAGLLFMDELEHLSLARTPKSPSLFVLGGAKFETKLPLVELLIERYDRVFVGGALANNFFVANGLSIGKSLISDIDIKTTSLYQHPKLLLPIDVAVLTPGGPMMRKLSEVAHDDAILDAGPETIAMLTEELRFVETLLWNGPLGDYERGFDAGTKQFAQAVAHAPGISIVGGGDTVASIQDSALTDRFTFVSTAGGAMLTFLEKGTLPGIEALRTAQTS